MNSATVSQSKPPMGKRLSYGLKTLGSAVLLPYSLSRLNPFSDSLPNGRVPITAISILRASRAKMQLNDYKNFARSARLFVKSYEIIAGSTFIPAYLSGSKEEISQIASKLEEKCGERWMILAGSMVGHHSREKIYWSLFEEIAIQQFDAAKLFGLLGDISCSNTICSQDAVFEYDNALRNLQAASKILKEHVEKFSSTRRMSERIAAKESEIEGKMLNSSEALLRRYEGMARGFLDGKNLASAQEHCKKALQYYDVAFGLASKKGVQGRLDVVKQKIEGCLQQIANAKDNSLSTFDAVC